MVKLESSVKNRVLALTLASTLVVGMIPFNAYGFNDTPSDQKQQTQTELKTIKSIPIGYSLVYGLSDNDVFKNENGEEIELTKIGKKSFVDFGFQKNSRYFWKYKFETNDQKGYLVVDKGLTVELKSEDQTINLNKIVSAANKDVYQYSAAGVLYVNGTENSVELGKVWSVGTNDGKTAVTEENITDVDLYFPDLDKKDLNKKIVYSIEKKDSCINLTTKQYNSDFQVALQSTSSDLYSQDKVSFAVEKNKDNKILENLKTDICVSTDGVTYESITEQNEYFINEKADYLNVKAAVSLSEDKILIEKEDKFVVKNGNPSVSNVSASVDNSILNILSFGIFANKEMTISAKIKDDGQKNYDEVLINDNKAEYNKDSDSYDIKLSSETYNTKPITIVLYSNSSTNKEKVLEYSTNTVYDKDNKEYKLKDDYKTVVLEQNKENSPKITITKDIIKEKVALDFSVNDAAKTEGSKNPGLNCTKVVIDKIILEDGKEKTENVVEYNKVNKIIEPDRDIANLNIKLNQTKDTAKNYKGGIITKNDFQLKINTDENKINIPDGKYRVTIKAINNVNNESSETVYFTIENPKPKVSVNISDSSGNNNTLNYKDKAIIKISVSDKNLTADKLKKDFNYSLKGVVNDNKTEIKLNEFKLNDSGKFVSETTIDTEGKYELNIVSITNDIGVSWEDGYNKKFTVDKNIPDINFEFDESIQNMIKEMLSFGLFTNEDVLVKVKFSDKISGINKDSIKIKNEDKDIDVSKSLEETEDGYLCKFMLNKEEAYKLKATVYDNAGRSNTVDALNNIIITSTDAEPTAKITELDGKVYNQKINVSITAESRRNEAHALPGLKAVSVKLLRKEKNGEFTTVFEDKDDGNSLSDRLVRVDNIRKDFSKTIIDKCDYTYSIDPEEKEVGSGYYKIVVTTVNNVFNKNIDNVTTTQKSGVFSLDIEPPNVDVSLKGTPKKIGDYDVYDQNTELTIKVSDVNISYEDLNKMEYSFTKTDPDGNNSTIDISSERWIQVQDGEGGVKNFTKTIKLDDEGFYEFSFTAIKDKLSDDMSNTQNTEITKKFAVDDKQPDIKVKYVFSNVVEEMLNILSFGIYSGKPVKAEITVTDKIAGVDKDTIVVKNSVDDSTIENVTFTSSDKQDKTYSATIDLSEDIAYKLSVTADDKLNRQTGNEISKTAKFSEDKDNIGVINGDVEKEIANTDDTPSINVTREPSEWTNNTKNVEYAFNVVSDKEFKEADPGLNSVVVSMLKWDYDKDNWFDEPVAVVTDDGGSIVNENNDFINFERTENKTANFKKDKITSQNYSLKLNTKSTNPLNISGKYKIKVDVYNNSVDADNNRYSATTEKEFGLDYEAPNVDVSLKGTPKKIGNYDVYDQNTELTIKVSDVNISYEDLNKMEYSFTKTDPDGNNSTIDISSERWIQVQDGEGGVKNFTKTIKLDDEGFYEFSFTAIKDKLSDDMSNTQNTEITKKFAVDDKQPDIKVKYVFSNVVEEMLNILSFGIYSGKPVKAEITVTDKIAGVDKDKIFVENSVDDSTIENVTFTSSDKRDKTCSATIDLSKDTAYKISVTADDKLNRQTGNEISKTAKFSKDKDNISVIDGDVEKEIANTDDTPSISVTQEPSEWTDKTKNVEYAFNVVSDKEFKGADPGLNSVVVSMLKWDYDKDNWFDEPVAVVTDDGGSIVNENNDFINFERTENKTANFKKDKITSQNYSLKLNTKSTNPLNISGKYKIKVDVYNNSVDADNNRYSATTEKEFGLDYEAPKISVKYDWADNDSNNIESVFGQDTYYNADRKITVEVKEYNFNLNDVKVTFANIITDEKGSNSSLEWEKKGNDFTGTFTFTDDPGEPNDGKYTVDIGRFSDPSGKSAVDEKDELYDGNNDKFIIDKTAPQIKVNFKWVENDSNNKKSVYGQDTYYNADKMITVVVTEHNFTLDYVKDTFANVITDEKDSKHSLEWLDNNDNTFTGTFIFTDDPGEPNDGKYAVNISKFTDHAENSAVNENGVLFSGEKDEFVIDTTKPIIDVSYSNLETKVTSHNGYDYYKAENIVATIAVTEHCFNNTNFKVSFKQLNIDGSQKNEVVVNDSNSNEWTHTTINNNNVYKLEVVIPGNNRYNNFWVDVTDLAGNSDEYRYDKKFVIDNTPPVRLNYSYDRAPIEKFIEVVTIGAYKSNIIVTLEGMDDVAGIKKIDYNYVGIGNSPSLDGVKEFEGEGASASFRNYSFNVKPNFKGYIIFRVTDFCGNVTEFNSRLTDPASGVTNGIVVDDRNPNIDKVAPVIKINPTGTPRNNIFNSDVKVNVEVNDPIVTGVSSGVSRIEYYIVNKTTNARFPATNYQVINNTVDKKSSNFNTSFEIDSKTFNSNNVEIVIMAYDNAGNSTEARKTISIDITAPVISVTYDNMQASKTGDTEYYKTDRTATITVTERNFDPADINYSVKNAHNVVPKLEGWTENKNNTDPDKTTHTAKIRYTADGDYTFDISFKDKAGNGANKIKTQKFTLDKTLPKIEVSYQNDVSPQNSNYYKKHRTAVIRINEHNFSWDGFNINFDIKGSDNQTKASAPSVSKSSAGSDVYTATVSFNHDGVFKFNVTYTDLAKNSARPFDSGTFYIDTSAPKIRIDGIKSNQAFDNNLTFTATVDEINYAGDVEYNIVRSDTQKKDYSSEVFKVSKSGDGKVITCNSPKKDKSTDGIYTFTITATDKAGNAETKSVKFSVNRFGSTYEVADDYSKNLLEKNKCVSKVNDIRIREVNVDEFELDEIIMVRGSDNAILSSNGSAEKGNLLICGEPEKKVEPNGWYSVIYTIKASNFTEDGPYSIKIKSKDKKLGKTYTNEDVDQSSKDKNETKYIMSFVVDSTKPLVSISGIESGIPYEEASKTITINCDDFNLDSDTLKILIGGKEYNVDKENIEASDGKLKIKFDIKASDYPDFIDLVVKISDNAGNVSEAKIEHFKLSASLLERFFINTPLVIAVFGGLGLLIVASIILIVVKRKNS